MTARRTFVVAALALLTHLARAAEPPATGLPEDVAQALLLSAGTGYAWSVLGTSPNQGYADDQAALNANDILSFEAGHAGGRRLLFRVGFARPPQFGDATLILYLDLDHDLKTGRQDRNAPGVDAMLVVSGDAVSLRLDDPARTPENTRVRLSLAGTALYATVETLLRIADGQVEFRASVLSERPGGRADSVGPTVARLPVAARDVAALPAGKSGSLRALSEYRYHDDHVKYEKLADKGLRRRQVTPAQPLQPGRPCPGLPYASQARQPGRAGAADRQQVRVEVLEEAGVARRQTPVTFGFPFPRGALFDPAAVRLLAADGREQPAQVTATAFWPDDSLKWVLVDTACTLGAAESAALTVEFGRGVRRAPPTAEVAVAEGPEAFVVTTGPLQARASKRRFDLLGEVRLDANGDGRFAADEQVLSGTGDGVVLLDEGGRRFTTAARPPDRAVVELAGPQRVVLRLEGAFAEAGGQAYLRCLARLTFRVGSPVVELALTTIDDYVEQEFMDITALGLALQPAAGVQRATVWSPGADGTRQPHEGAAAALRQTDERTCTWQAGAEQGSGGQSPGLLCVGGPRGVLGVALQDFWQRWPKGLSADARQVTIDLLPAQSGPEYGRDLPHHLMYPFCEGKYRLKWGMAFTERLRLGFGDGVTAEQLLADADRPVVAVVPAAWYAETQAMGRVAAPLGQQFASWDRLVAESYRLHLAQQARTREFGYLNYGDWFGERGRNWGNNEYDRAHGFFVQFARTGNRDYFRLALAVARHQADVDTVHAYPDPYNVGAQNPHSVAHTGAWSEATEHGQWSTRYGSMTSAANGHAWADGLVEAWCLAGDERAMEGAMEFGEHIVWAMSPTFRELGTHERSAGWSLKAIAALYGVTADPAYLEAAGRIVAVPLREQKFDQGGAWPHVLPRDHAGDRPGAVGNNLFLMGILLRGLQAYHEIAPDDAVARSLVARSLVAGAGWVAKSWDAKAGGWPYSASPTGEPYYPASTSLDALIAEPLAYTATLTGDAELMAIAEQALVSTVFGGPRGDGKSLAQQMTFTGGALALLQAWSATHAADKGASILDGSDRWLAQYMAHTPDAEEHRVRAPDRKRFVVRLRAANTELVAIRTPHGAMTKRAESATVRVLDAKGAVVGESSCSTDSPYEWRCPLRGEPGAEFAVVVDDDQRGVWGVRAAQAAVVMQTGPEFRIGGVGRHGYYFRVPTGAAEFRVGLVGVHPGGYGGMVLTPGGEPAAFHQGVNQGQALIAGAAKADVPAPDAHPEIGTLTVRPAAADTGKVWRLVLWASGDLGCDLQGVPPYLGLTPDAVFEPRP